MIIDAIVPARNEASTVGAVVRALRASTLLREVIVVDDGSTDGTGEVAVDAGAKVIRRDGASGSKAHAMEVGVAASDAAGLLFVDADLLGHATEHFDAILKPFIAGRCVMSIGTFDYGVWNTFVLRFPPTTGERVVPRWVFEAIPPSRLDGYTIEMMINEVVAEGKLRTVAQVMKGVTHRTKRDKFGPVEGWRRTWQMFKALAALPINGVIRWRVHVYYLRGLTVVSGRRTRGGGGR